MKYPEPYLSLVVTSRNDDHGQNLLARMQTFVNAWIGQCQRHDLPAELIIVEWNPPPERPRLAQALRWPDDPSPCQVRIIEVPPERHRRFQYAEALPLFQMIGKNVGIRRARGRFVLATNIDIVFSDELVRFLKEGALQPGRMYRIDRHDVMAEVPVEAPVEEQLAYCRNHLLRLNCREGAFALTPDGRRTPVSAGIADPAMELTLEDGWYGPESYLGEPFHWGQSGSWISVQPPPGPARELSLDIEPGPGVGASQCELQVLDEGGQLVARGLLDDRQLVYLTLPLVPGRPNRFQLIAPSVGRVCPNDPRVLDFRLFRCMWYQKLAPALTAPPPSGPFNFRAKERGQLLLRDIAAEEIGLRLGEGWYGAEWALKERFRWVDDGATIIVDPPTPPPDGLSLEVEPGPGVGGRPFWLQLRDEYGRTIARQRVTRRHWVRFPLRLQPGQVEYLRLHVEGGGQPTAGADTRTLNFRVFRLAWSTPWTSRCHLPLTRLRLLWRHRWEVTRKALRAGLAALRQGTGAVARPAAAAPAEAATGAHVNFPRYDLVAPAFLHTNACGDFTLMAREDWVRVRGNPELEIFSFHLDSLLCWTAHNAGVKEEVFKEPLRIYHIEHGKGSGWTPEGESQLMARIAAKGIPALPYQECMDLALKMTRLERPLILNYENWGLADEDLPETVIGTGPEHVYHRAS